MRSGDELRRDMELADLEAQALKTMRVTRTEEYTAVSVSIDRGSSASFQLSEWHVKPPRAGRRSSIDRDGPASLQWQKKEEGSHAVKLAGCLWPFLKLAQASDEAILQFVEMWGILGVEPTTFVPIHNWIARPDLEAEAIYREPIQTYRDYANEMKSMLLRAIAIRNWSSNNSVSFKDPAPSPSIFLGVDIVDIKVEGTKYGWSSVHWVVQRGVDFLLKKARVSPVLSLDVATGRMGFGLEAELGFSVDPDVFWWWEDEPPSPLFSALVFELVAVLTSESGAYICDVCGNPFAAPVRALRPDRKRFCGDECRLDARRATVRASNRKQRQEMKALRSGNQEGAGA